MIWQIRCFINCEKRSVYKFLYFMARLTEHGELGMFRKEEGEDDDA